MTKNILILAISLLFFACSNKHINVKNETEIKNKTTVKSKTYAEISIKEGGVWENRKYIGGGAFKNVQEFWVPKEHTDHSFDIRYEGPGWENGKIAFRLYLDWRNAIDIYGKFNDTLILAGIGQDGFDSYHEMSTWGTDILKVGKALGIGGLGRYVEKEVKHFETVDSTYVKISNSHNESQVGVYYYGWDVLSKKTNLVSNLSITPDVRYSKHTFTASELTEGICTGIVKHGFAVKQKDSDNGKWAYIATYGEQTLVPDKLGMGILYRKADVSEFVDAAYDYLLVFKPTTKPVSFYFLGAWEKENGGIKTEQEFEVYINSLLKELNDKDKF